MMKSVAFLVALLAVASAFAPNNASPRTSVAVNSLFDDIVNMDLWKDQSDRNKYGARASKNLTPKDIGSGGYVPDGLSASEYNSIRKNEAAKKAANYQRNVAKAGKFQDFTDFYLRRGTSEGGSWLKKDGRGHDFVKTKYDWSGKSIEDNKPFFEA
ncbi:expressed unknown protein [Seminavis robusta]|uniref:Uncharacterized protein n=1 Tax=Seminavis robusta TaxID=568900 RepID=A0A9N8EVM6_9STRA|nr:expressed unknown protein [Seminavis robusta]|eukprot:Sro1899_g304170.1 n/a (156) ;mRNA; f:2252-2835